MYDVFYSQYSQHLLAGILAIFRVIFLLQLWFNCVTITPQ